VTGTSNTNLSRRIPSKTYITLRRRVIHPAKTRSITFVVCSELRFIKDDQSTYLKRWSSQWPIASNWFQHVYLAFRRRHHPPLSQPHTGTNFGESDLQFLHHKHLSIWRMKPLIHEKAGLLSFYSSRSCLARLGRHPNTGWNPRPVPNICSNNLTGPSRHK
jgi:hypothetical protein